METLRNKYWTKKDKEEKSMEKFRIKKFKNIFLGCNYSSVLKIEKELVVSPKFGGYGLKKGAFLSFVYDSTHNHYFYYDDWDDPTFIMFPIPNGDFTTLCGINHSTYCKYVHEFNNKGFYELLKPNEYNTDVVKGFWMRVYVNEPIGESWKVPKLLIRPSNLGGFGLKHGMVLYYLINKCLSDESEIFEISNRNIAKCFGMHNGDVPAILKRIEKTEMAKFGDGLCYLDLEFIGMYFSDMDNAWGIIADNEVKNKDIPNTIRELTHPLLFELVEL